MLQSSLHLAVANVLQAGLGSEFSVLARTERELVNDLQANSLLQTGFAIFVMEPMETSAIQGTSFVFCDGCEIRVRLVELMALNTNGPAIHDVKRRVMQALHWQPSKAIDDEMAVRLAADPGTDAETVPSAMELDSNFSAYFALGEQLAHPLSLARRPVDWFDGKLEVPGFSSDGEALRICDVVFNAVLQLSDRPQT